MPISLSLFNSIHRKCNTIGDLSKDRNNNFDAIRFLAASAVIFSHSYLLITGNNYEIFFLLSKDQITLGKLSVAIFFIVSGFLICSSWEKSNSIVSFMKSRILRIFPGLFFVVLVTAFLLGPLVTTLSLKDYFSNAETYMNVKSVFLPLDSYKLPGVFSNNPFDPQVNASLWTLKYEFLCYMIIAVLGITRTLRKSSVLILFLIFFPLFEIARYFYTNPIIEVKLFHSLMVASHVFSNLDGLTSVLQMFCCFIIGMIFYLFRIYIPLDKYLALLSFCVLILSLFIGKFFIEVFLLFGSYLVFYFAFSKNIKLHSFAKYGDFSYGLYIYSFPIQQTIILCFHSNISPLTEFIFSYPITLVCAVISWHVIEKQALKLKHKRK